MAGGKETPRQKMIGMMYLVLTALLALNVSKSILQAFVTVNESLVQTTDNSVEKNNTSYNDFEVAFNENPEKVRVWRDKAQDVKKKSQELVAYIEELKGKVIGQTHGVTKEDVMGPGPDGFDTAFSLHNPFVTALDNYDVPAAALGLADPAAPKELEDGYSAPALENKIHAYRDAMLEILPASKRDGQIGKTLKELFELPNRMEHDQEVTWSVGNFYHAPLAAAVTHLSKVSADVRNAEADMLSFLLTQIDAGSFKFNKLAPAVIANSSYLLQGDTFRADVFLAAFDTTQTPLVTFAPTYADSGEGGVKFGADTLSGSQLVIKDGKGQIKIPASSEGIFALKGRIAIKGPEGDYIPYNVETAYQVSRPSLTVSATKMNVFYKGVDNPVSISVPGVPADKIKPSISTGSLSKSGKEGYVVRVKSGNKAIISVSATMPDGSSAAMGKSEFRVKTVPDPKPYFAGKGQSDDRVKKKDLTAAQGVAARMENFDFDLKFKVTSFKMTMIVGGTPVEKIAKGNRLSSDMKTIVKKSKPGSKIYIENIKAKGPDGTIRNLGSIALKVI